MLPAAIPYLSDMLSNDVQMPEYKVWAGMMLQHSTTRHSRDK